MPGLSIKLTSFEGPLDLLLALIEKNKIDIYDIPIADITDQYMEYISDMSSLDMDLASDFLVMAATLLDIKARMLLPADEEPAAEDPRSELVERMLEYKLFKQVSQELKGMNAEASRELFREESLPDEVALYRPAPEPEKLLEDVTAERLNKVYSYVMKRMDQKKDVQRSRFKSIKKDRFTVNDKINELLEKSAILSGTGLCGLLSSQPDRFSLVTVFLAVLETVRMGSLKLVPAQGSDDLILYFE